MKSGLIRTTVSAGRNRPEQMMLPFARGLQTQAQEESWRAHWHGMPEFVSENKKSRSVLRIYLENKKRYDGKQAFVTVHFRERDPSEHLKVISERLQVSPSLSMKTEKIELNLDEASLAEKLFDGKHTIGHHSCWYPWKENDPHSAYVYRQRSGASPVNPEYPVYIISKGRWELPLTARALERMAVPYTLVVEPKEYANYKTALNGTYDDGKKYIFGTVQKSPENFSERGQGSIPVRNFVWDLAIKTGKDRHWLMDDNIPTFNRTNHNLGVRVQTGAIFRAVEVFADRYENIAIAGLQNSQFVLSKWEWPAFFLNTRVYSCTLIKNDLRLTNGLSSAEINTSKGRWRGKYNEDTDLCIRALKAGWCTVLFVTFNADKVGTMVMKGGNTDALYTGDGRKKMAESLQSQHPNEVKVGWRWNRAQHIVNYPACAEIGKKAQPGGCVLKRRTGIVIPSGTDNFGMVRAVRDSI